MKTLVFIHGLFGSSNNWTEVINNLPLRYKTLAIDLPIKPTDNFDHKNFGGIPELTNYLHQQIQHIDEDIILCGNSLGGQIALDYIIKKEKYIAGLVITGSAGLFEHNISQKYKPQITMEGIRARAEEIFYNKKFCTDKMIGEIYEMLNNRKYLRFLLKVAKSTRDYNLSEQLAKIDIPTLIVWGKDDNITPPFVAEQFNDKITNSRLEYIAECGHSPPIEQPEKFAKLLLDFI